MDDNITEEYKLWWETKMFLQTEELDRMFLQPEEPDGWGLDEAFSGYYDSSSPDGAATSPASKNILSERNRRKKLNDRLYTLRSVVPNITKMDKASIIKDAIEYIQELHQQEKRIQAEISQLESTKKNFDGFDQSEQQVTPSLRSKKKRTDQVPSYQESTTSPIELLEIRVSYMGEKTVVVSLTCSKRRDTMVKLCEVFESLKLKIITANITAFSGRLLKTVFLEADEEEKDQLKARIETAIAALNDPPSPMSI